MLIPKNLGAFLPWNHDLEIAVGIQVSCDDVQSNACTFGRDMLAEVLKLFVPSVVHDDRNVIDSRVTAVVPGMSFQGFHFLD